MNKVIIDVNFEFTADSNGRDPDVASPTLRRFHRILWSKPLPDGRMFSLDMNEGYLNHKSYIGEFFLKSDSIAHTYSKWKRTQSIIKDVDDEIEKTLPLAYTIGGYIIFPGNVINGLHTLNQARGTSRFISDRFDLTLECIRRFYDNNQDSPLKEVINRYRNFFELFIDFNGYCDFFLLQDLLDDDSNQIRFFMPFNEFSVYSFPRTANEYRSYLINVRQFIVDRNNRILSYQNRME